MMPWLLALFSTLSPRVLAAAQEITPVGDANVANIPSPVTILNTIYQNAFGIISLLVGILAVLYVVYAGIQYILSAGSPDKIKTARATLINAVIGIIIVVAAYFFIKLAISAGGFLNNVGSNL